MSSATSRPTETFSTGIPVQLGSIERELKKLWEQGDELMTRASLINLAVYSEAPASLQANTQIVAELTKEHACRAIVIAADPAAPDEQVEAWIAAHCHVSRAGSKQVCSEQISFALSGALANLLPSIVFSHLDSDLPLYLWWQGEFHDPMDAQLWTWVDRLIYDSQTWSNFDAQMRLVETAQRDANQRVVLCDLNWTRLVHLRLAIAQFFDSPAAQEQLANIKRVEVEHAPQFRSTALLLAGWLAAQLGWTLLEAADENTLAFCDCAGETMRVSLVPTQSQTISRCTLFCDGAEFRVSEEQCGDLLNASTFSGGELRTQRLLPAGGNDAVCLLREELMRGGPHGVYLRAVAAVRELL